MEERMRSPLQEVVDMRLDQTLQIILMMEWHQVPAVYNFSYHTRLIALWYNHGPGERILLSFSTPITVSILIHVTDSCSDRGMPPFQVLEHLLSILSGQIANENLVNSAKQSSKTNIALRLIYIQWFSRILCHTKSTRNYGRDGPSRIEWGGDGM